MLEIDDLLPTLQSEWFKQDHIKLERNLLLSRLGMTLEPLSPEERRRLQRFSQAVIAGAAIWREDRDVQIRALCQAAADIEAGLAASAGGTRFARLAVLKSIILYELASLPGASATYAGRSEFDIRFRDPVR